MSRMIPMVCEACDALWYVGRFEEEAPCPKCGWVNDVLHDGFDDRRYEDEQ